MVQYGGVLFRAEYDVHSNGEVVMTEHDPIAELGNMMPGMKMN